MSPTPTKSLSYELTDLYDDFVEFNDYCAFLCDSIPLLFREAQEREPEDHTLAGLRRHCNWMKKRADELELALEKVQQKSLDPVNLRPVK